jgi:DHA2 family multidrug resistance protein
MSSPSIIGSKGGITAAVLCATVMAVIDISIVNVALSDIRATYAAPLDRIGWVSTSYMMANVVVIPMTGWLQRRFGFRRYYVASILLFTLASCLCGLAWNFASLIGFRVLQGIGGGAVIPTSQAILIARYPRREHTMAGALFGLASITGPLLGPTVGGYLIDLASWHWIFYVNVPLGALSAAIAWRHIREPGFRAATTPVDASGAVLLAVGMGALQYALEEGNRHGWWEDTTIVVVSIVAFIALVTFVVHEFETDAPIVALRVFRNKNYAAGTAINLLAGMALFSSAYLFSLYCGAVMRYAALDIGLVFLAAGAVQFVVMPVVGKFGAAVDGRKIMGVGLVLTIASFWLNGHLTQQAGFWTLVLPQMLRTVGLGLVFVPLTVITLSDLPAEEQGTATGLFNLTRELGGTIGTAWMGTLVDRHHTMHYAYLTQRITPMDVVADQEYAALVHGPAAPLPDAAASALAMVHAKLSVQALTLAFNDGFLQMSLVFFVGLGLVAILAEPKAGVAIEGAH